MLLLCIDVARPRVWLSVCEVRSQRDIRSKRHGLGRGWVIKVTELARHGNQRSSDDAVVFFDRIECDDMVTKAMDYTSRCN